MKILELNNAYDILKDPVKRRLYDSDLQINREKERLQKEKEEQEKRDNEESENHFENIYNELPNFKVNESKKISTHKIIV